MKKHSFMFLSIVALFCISNVTAQVAGYTFSASSGTFTPISGGTDVNSIEVDSELSTDLPIGFNFYFDGNTYTTFRASSNGFISFGTSTAVHTTNNLDGVSAASKPLIAPLWDDLAGSTSSNSQASYVVTGTAPNRVLTFEWLDWEWNYASSVPVISFQVKLYETTNEVQFIYRADAGAVSSASASIGLTGINDFISLDGSGANPGVSSTTETSTINTKPVTGQTYTFTPPSCPGVTNLSVSNLTSSSADLGWTDNAGASQWEVEYGTVGFTQGTGTTISPATNPQNINSLSPNTDYEFYVRADCGSGDYSNWVGPFQFTTLCSTFSVPHLEDFTNFLPGCWDEAGSGTPASGPGGVGSSDWTQEDYLNNGPDQAATINLYYNNDEEWLISPSFDLSTGGPYELRTQVGITTYSGTSSEAMGADDEVQVLISTDGGTTWTNLFTWNQSNQPTNSGSDEIINLSAYNNNDIKFALWATDGSVIDAVDYNFYVNEFEIREVPACPQPTALYANNITGSSAEIGWTDNSGSGLFDIEVGPTGFTPTGTPTESGINSNPYMLNGLSQVTSYDYYVRTDCGGTGQSVWSGPFTFTTGQIPVSTFPYIQDWESGQGGWEISNGSETNEWYIGTATNNGGSQALYISDDGGTTNSYTTYYSSEVHAYRDIQAPSGYPVIELSFDWRGDGENGYDMMKVYLAPTSFTPTAGTEISTSGSAPTGIVQLGGEFSDEGSYISESFTLDPSYEGQSFRVIFEWQNDSYSGTQPPAAVDNIMIDVATCGLPSNLSVSNETNTTADIDWDEFASEPGWNVQFGPSGFVIGNGTTWNITAASDTTLDNLTQNTEYDVYVQSDCGSNDTTAWVGPITFTTKPDCPAPSSFQITGSTATSVDLSFVDMAGVSSWNVEYGPAGFTPGTGVAIIENVTTETPTINGLQAGVVYEFYVEADCSSDNPFAGPLTYATPINNDDACDAVSVPVDGSTTQFTNEGATLETGELTTNGDNTVWFTFIAPTDGHVEIRTCGNDFDNFIEVYEEPTDCGDFNTYTLVDEATDNPFATCNGTYDPAGLVLCGLTPGNTYYLAVGSETAGSTGIFPLTLTAIPNAEAGTATIAQACSGDMVTLSDALSGNDNGGVWSEIDMTGGLEANGVYNTTNLAYIGYDVEYRVTNECSYDSTIVTVSISGPSSAGQDGTLTDCNVETDFYLYDGLSGNLDFGGTWIDVDGTGKLNGSVFSPDSLAAGTYQFDYVVSNDVCPNDTSTVEVTITDCLSTQEFDAESFKIFPNPTNGIFYMVSTANASNAIVEITDLQGKVISSEQMNINIGVQYDFNLSQLERGVYLIRVATEDNSTVKRVVLQR